MKIIFKKKWAEEYPIKHEAFHVMIKENLDRLNEIDIISTANEFHVPKEAIVEWIKEVNQEFLNESYINSFDKFKRFYKKGQKNNPTKISKVLGVSRTTIYSYIKKLEYND